MTLHCDAAQLPQPRIFRSRPVQLIVPYAPGGSGDLIARLLGDKLSALWGQQVVIENRPGAGAMIGTETAAHAPADGYTLYLATDGPLTVAATLHQHVPYDWKRDFAPVSMITVGYQVLIVDPKLPVHNAGGLHRAGESQSRARLISPRSASAPRRTSPPSCSSRSPISS